MNKSSNEIIVQSLIEKLLIHRNSPNENALCILVREMPEEDKLNVIDKLRGVNVRLAATVAMRIHLAISQQLILLERLLAEGGSNAISVFITHLFSVRLGVTRILQILRKQQEKTPRSVHFAAYYFLGATKCSQNKKMNFKVIMQHTTQVLEANK